MAICRGHVQGAAAVQRQVATAEQRSVRLVGIGLKRVISAISQRVLRAIGQGHEALVRILHVRCRPIFVMDGRACKHQLHLVVIARGHQQLPVGQLTRNHVRARRRDGDAVGGSGCARAGNCCGIALEHDGGGS